jgi:hypothetical protein
MHAPAEGVDDEEVAREVLPVERAEHVLAGEGVRTDEDHTHRAARPPISWPNRLASP